MRAVGFGAAPSSGSWVGWSAVWPAGSAATRRVHLDFVRVDECFLAAAAVGQLVLHDRVGMLCVPLPFTPLPVAFFGFRDSVQVQRRVSHGEWRCCPWVHRNGAESASRSPPSQQNQRPVIGSEIVAGDFGDQWERGGGSGAEL